MHPAIDARNPATREPSPGCRRLARPWRTLESALLLALALAASVAQSTVPKAKSIQELKAFYRQNCVRCHGLDGSGGSPEGKKLGGRDFTKAAQDFPGMGGPASEREIRTMIKTIQKGLFFGRIMPSWKDQLSLEEAELMVRKVLLKSDRGQPIEPDLITASQ